MEYANFKTTLNVGFYESIHAKLIGPSNFSYESENIFVAIYVYMHICILDTDCGAPYMRIEQIPFSSFFINYSFSYMSYIKNPRELAQQISSESHDAMTEDATFDVLRQHQTRQTIFPRPLPYITKGEEFEFPEKND